MEYVMLIQAVRTATVNGNPGVIKQVDWLLRGQQDDVEFDLLNTTDLGDPEEGATFIEFDNVTQEDVVAWVEATDERIPAIKAHIAMVVEKELSKKALASPQLPWTVVEIPAE